MVVARSRFRCGGADGRPVEVDGTGAAPLPVSCANIAWELGLRRRKHGTTSTRGEARPQGRLVRRWEAAPDVVGCR